MVLMSAGSLRGIGDGELSRVILSVEITFLEGREEEDLSGRLLFEGDWEEIGREELLGGNRIN